VVRKGGKEKKKEFELQVDKETYEKKILTRF
jgi:hypothetical protein